MNSFKLNKTRKITMAHRQRYFSEENIDSSILWVIQSDKYSKKKHIFMTFLKIYPTNLMYLESFTFLSFWSFLAIFVYIPPFSSKKCLFIQFKNKWLRKASVVRALLGVSIHLWRPSGASTLFFFQIFEMAW